MAYPKPRTYVGSGEDGSMLRNGEGRLAINVEMDEGRSPGGAALRRNATEWCDPEESGVELEGDM